MKRLTRQESREVDRNAIEQLGFSGLVLMENAGRGAVDTLERLGIVREGVSIALICGKGNNGGDGFVMARHLRIRHYRPTVVLLARPDELTGDAKANFDLLRHSDVDVFSFAEITDANRPELERLLRRNVLIDAMLGTGAVGAPREPQSETIRLINEYRRQDPAVRVVAVDLPSGLDADTGRPNEPTTIADITLTFYSEKVGFIQPGADRFLGDVHVHDIGIVSR